MPLVFRIRTNDTLPVDGSWADPARLAGLSRLEICRTAVTVGNRIAAVGDVWEVTGTAGDGEFVFEGNHACVNRLGSGLSQGTMRILGDAGDHCGAALAGGRIIVEGNAGHAAGCAMSGGRIEITGNCGDHAGGHVPGARRGMTGGELVIGGSTGDFCGARMRRGFIAVGGDAGVGAGQAMIAGTLLVRGRLGELAGVGMKRGTLVQLTPEARDFAPAFAPSWQSDARFLIPYLNALPAAWPRRETLPRRFHYHRGDVLELGLGEILVAEAEG